MKKRFLTGALAVVMILSVTACNNDREQQDVTPGNVIEQPENTVQQPESVVQQPENKENESENKEEEQTVYVAEYEDILADTYEFIVNIEDKVGPDEGFYGIWDAAIALGDEALGKIAYLFKDINDDSVYELMIGVFDKADGAYTNNEVYALYTLKNGNPELLFEGWSRSMYSLKEDNSFFYHGSSGAAYSIFGTYHIDKNCEMVCDDYYFTYPDDNDPEIIEIYHNKTGSDYREESEKLDITLDDFWSLEEEVAKGTVKLSATAFADLDENIVEKALTVEPAPAPSHIVGEWVMISGETDGYEYTAEEAGIQSEILITSSDDGMTAEYFSKMEYVGTDTLKANLELCQEPLYIGCGNDEWSVVFHVTETTFDPEDEFYATLIDENTLLLRNIFPFDGTLGVSHQTYKRK
ncbi:MAG: hypothetical protein E7583_04155 [Ruminococcaceae bacterium]|nr:hypothetical protein [Oscillospiraceae bacterium]